MARFLSLVGLAAVGLRGVAALPSVQVVSEESGEFHIMDETPNYPAAPDTISTCTWWWDNDGSIACKDMPGEWGISMANFLAWNPSITAECGNYVTGKAYCVEAPAASEPGTTSTVVTTPTSTSVGNGVTTPTPTQDGMVGNCNKFHFVQANSNCDDIAKTYSITRAQFVSYNPAVGDTCSGMWANVYVCVGVIGGASPVTTTASSTTVGNGVTTPTPTQAGMVDNCNKFHFVQANSNCDDIAKTYSITRAQFVSYNPSVGDTCSGMWANVYVCVGVIGGSPVSTTTPASSTTVGNGIATPTPTQADMVNNCNAFHFVEANSNCDDIAKKYGITRAQFVSYNPSVGSTCSGMWANVYVCVGIIGGSPVTSTATPTSTGNGIATPTPTQPEMITDCNKFYLVKSGDTCATIASANNLSQTQFRGYNPSVGTDCTGLWLDAYVCVGRIGTVTPTTTTTLVTTTKTGNGVATPTPIQDGMVTNCNKFQFVSTTTTCQSILDTNKITLAQFTKWNPGAGSGCNNLWANTYACVGVIS